MKKKPPASSTVFWTLTFPTTLIIKKKNPVNEPLNVEIVIQGKKQLWIKYLNKISSIYLQSVLGFFLFLNEMVVSGQ